MTNLTPEYKDQVKAAALKWVNDIRALRGLEPRKELLPGIKGHIEMCCLARSLNDGLVVGRNAAMENGGTVGHRVYPFSSGASTFRKAFDSHQFPELVISRSAIK